MRTEIPIFFSTDDHYMPYLDVAVASLIANAFLIFLSEFKMWIVGHTHPHIRPKRKLALTRASKQFFIRTPLA